MAFESILKPNNDKKGALLTSSGACFDFDIVTLTQHTSKLKITENPLENGTNVADHAVLDPKEISLSGIMVGYTPPGQGEQNKFTLTVPMQYALPTAVQTMTAQAAQMIDKISDTYNQVQDKTHKVLAYFLPDYEEGKTPSTTPDRIADAYNMLLTLQKSGETLTITTNLKQYQNMMITSISATEKSCMTGEFAIVAREVFIAYTEMAEGLNLGEYAQTLKSNLGVTQPQQVEQMSMLRKLMNIF